MHLLHICILITISQTLDNIPNTPHMPYFYLMPNALPHNTQPQRSQRELRKGHKELQMKVETRNLKQETRNKRQETRASVLILCR